ncbi:Ig-like domain-containing protein [Pyxidicoccus xibeiensis]|uniref:Ig-like domain-containing protein n=1 Tax=Pyxidicoccus xibeiensis TaxID=2906759 RepID=UPI0020A757B8|nr:Ig-like domain-containing protein [Pyxidicoccus xibeiensis]MCP3136371.1 Ig-like domain-containing protein [Pyxidicoccus xibeiensis]
MRFLQPIVVFAVFLSWACINVPEVVQVPETPDAGEPDAHLPDSGAPGSGPQDLTVQFHSSRTITNREVLLKVTLSGAKPDEVELLVDGVAVATLTPPYELRWDTRSISEGEHVLAVRATLGERKFTSDSRNLVVDRTPPRVISQMPIAGSRTVSIHQTIQATFSEALDANTVSADSVKLLSQAEKMGVEVSLSPEGTFLTLRPGSPLPVDTALSVSFDNSVTDLAGNPLQWSEQAWEWTVPGYIPLGTPLAYSPDGDGSLFYYSLQVPTAERPVVAWVSGGPLGENYGVHVSRWNGSNWEQLGRVLDANPGSTHPSGCSLQVDAGGQLFIAWTEGTESGMTHVHVRRWNGSDWQAVGAPVLPLSSNAGLNHFQFDVNKTGNMILGLFESGGSGSQVSVWHWSGSGWSVLGGALKVNPAWNLSSMQVQIDDAGRAVVTWSETESSGVGTPYMRRWNGSSWEEIIMPFQGHLGYPGVLALDGSGNPILARTTWDGAAGTALHAHVWRWDGSSWSAVGQPFGGLYPGVTDARVGTWGLDDEGRLLTLLVEPEVPGGAAHLYVRRWTGATWEPVGGLLKPNPGANQIVHATLAVDPTGQPVLARIEQTDSQPYKRRIYIYTPND